LPGIGLPVLKLMRRTDYSAVLLACERRKTGFFHLHGRPMTCDLQIRQALKAEETILSVGERSSGRRDRQQNQDISG
jgi:hypothetical protein